MNKTNTIILIVIILIIGGVYFLITNNASDVEVPSNKDQSADLEESFDVKNSTFTIDNKSVTLVNGISETTDAPGSASKTTTTYFGNETKGDLNRDGLDDVAFLVTQNSSGSGTFYYAVVALKTSTGYTTTNAFLIGDRIAPQNNNIIASELHINYAERKAGEPMTASPTQGAVTLLKVSEEGTLEGLMK